MNQENLTGEKMIRRAWQQIMIGLARSERFKSFMQQSRSMSSLSHKYVAGSTPLDGAQVARNLSQKGIKSSLFYLGEYVDTLDKAHENLTAKLSISPLLADRKLDLHISVDPTQVGGAIKWDYCIENIKEICSTVENLSAPIEGFHCVMLDMEDFSVNQATIDLHDELLEEGYPVALTLQAYLKKTSIDISKKIAQGAKVRLVKGAFVASSDIAFQGHKEIKENYRHLIDQMLSESARKTGFYPIFATHDHTLHEYAIERARENGWEQGTYEFEMLYGARNDIAEQLAIRGERIRLYTPFGYDWWPYAVRRIGENPSSALLLLRSFLNI